MNKQIVRPCDRTKVLLEQRRLNSYISDVKYQDEAQKAATSPGTDALQFNATDESETLTQKVKKTVKDLVR